MDVIILKTEYKAGEYIGKSRIDNTSLWRVTKSEYEKLPEEIKLTRIKSLEDNSKGFHSIKLPLDFDRLRKANIARLPLFKNKHGELAHSKPDGSDWSPAQWLQAVMGELGEYANIRKKFERGDISKEVFDVEAAKELADVQIYLDILAFQLKIDLGQATIDKYNEVSDRIGIDLKL